MDKPIQVVIADDHPILLEGLRKLLEAESDILVAVSYTHLTLPTNREV